ncbi:MAG: hypothetical protein ACOCVE_03810 [Desulfovermiculus sp.]
MSIALNKKRLLVCIFLFLGHIIIPGLLWAGEQIVHLDDTSDLVSQGSGRERAMLVAVVRESAKVLPGDLDSAREKALAEFIQPRYQELILSYSRLGGGSSQEQIWQIQINTDALIKLLKELGVYYTVNNSLTYRLELINHGGSGQERISDLELLSGCTQGNVQHPLFKIQTTSDGKLQGILEGQRNKWTASGDNVEELWWSLWARYFSSSEEIRSFVQEVLVHIKGWSTLSAISGFSRQLTNWPQVVDQSSLVSLRGDSYGLHGWWKVITPQSRALHKRLEEFSRSRDLDLKVQKQSEDKG